MASGNTIQKGVSIKLTEAETTTLKELLQQENDLMALGNLLARQAARLHKAKWDAITYFYPETADFACALDEQSWVVEVGDPLEELRQRAEMMRQLRAEFEGSQEHVRIVQPADGSPPLTDEQMADLREMALEIRDKILAAGFDGDVIQHFVVGTDLTDGEKEE